MVWEGAFVNFFTSYKVMGKFLLIKFVNIILCPESLQEGHLRDSTHPHV